MMEGILSALTLLFSLLIEQTFVSALPTPWREVSLPLLFGILMMYRVSLPLGVLFLLTAGILTVVTGLGTGGIIMAYIAAAAAGVLLSTWVFARRSLAAMGGFALLTSSAYAFVRAFFSVIHTAREGFVFYPGIVFLHFVFTVIASAACIVFLSLAYTSLSRALGNRFIRKDVSYEVRGR
jgi:hypothetical protein